MNLRPTNHLNTISKRYPGIWKNVDLFRKSKGKDLGDWPEWCFLPMAASYAIASNGGGISLSAASDISTISALTAWRYTQGIYCFDSDVYAEIVKTTVDKDIPVDVLYRLPEWGVYIELLDVDGCYGFFAHLEFDMTTKRSELRLLIDSEDMLIPIILHLGDWGVAEAIDRAVEVAYSRLSLLEAFMADSVEWQRGIAQKCLSLLLYLCSEKPDIERVEGNLPTNPTPKKLKKDTNFLLPTNLRFGTLGKRLQILLHKLPLRVRAELMRVPKPIFDELIGMVIGQGREIVLNVNLSTNGSRRWL
ncbi:hypothetical protein L3V31_15290 [Vibrio sp. J1-1]|uniref:hypothetical protein n=1 Tax=Vibrio sp. J1-1 TaxID=2912251 RepID=UPI001F4294B6|nr:hypothetical protein [Vibrio sp. J1-1]MCF7483078.1 hypothetical protein [Vibrio sp. J1-1]